ncbi:unnamed protein product [Trichobilharzia regenti]|nr:unnamed protein product [Trichobilharzia regenti]
MMTKSTSPSFHGSMKSQKRLTPDSFTLVSLLSAIEPANMKRNLILCHNNNSNNNDKDSLKQTASNADNVFRFSPFQLAIILWHDLLPYTHQSLVPHHFTLLANIMSLQNNCLDSNNSELLFVKNTQCKSFQDLLKYDALMDSKQTVYLPIHPSCTSSELATLMISQASQLSSLSSSMPSSQENPLRESTTVQKTSEVNHLDWENTMLALASPINVLLPTDKPIVICGPKNQSLAPWQRLALVGGLHGFIDVIENHYKLKPGLPFMTSLVRLLPYPNKLDNNYENDFDLWEKEFLSLLPRFKLRPDTGIYNALINRRTSAGVSPSHLLAEMTRQGLFPDQITWGCLARGCETVQSVEKLLNAFKIASMPSSTSSSISSSNELLNNNDAIMNTSIHSRIHSPVIRPSFTFFSTLLTTSEFNWELKTFIIEYMMRQAHVDELSDKNKPTKKKNRQNRSNNVKSKQEEEDEEEQQTSSKNDKSSNQYNGYVLDRRLIASLEIDISLFRELLVKGVIPKGKLVLFI